MERKAVEIAAVDLCDVRVAAKGEGSGGV